MLHLRRKSRGRQGDTARNTDSIVKEPSNTFQPVIASEAKQSISPSKERSWIASSLALLAMTALKFQKHIRARRAKRPSCA
jgi:hypothetical protein